MFGCSPLEAIGLELMTLMPLLDFRFSTMPTIEMFLVNLVPILPLQIGLTACTRMLGLVFSLGEQQLEKLVTNYVLFGLALYVDAKSTNDSSCPLQVSLSKKAEGSLLEAIQSRRHGDTLYFWVRMDKDPRNTLQQDFWSFCDTINAGNCRSVLIQKKYER
jgi:hypothetical protein